MAQSKSFFGIRSGSTKTLTFQRGAGGKQITKDRVYEITNPRTNNQQGQRAKFAEVVQFYKRGIQAYFKFAYEDKRANESDYNAYMRHNVGLGVYMTKDQVNDPNVPMIGAYMMAGGSLPTLQISAKQENGNQNVLTPAGAALTLTSADIVLPESGDAVMTVGTISRAIIRAYGLNGYQAGDILTVAYIYGDATFSTEAPYITPGTTAPTWYILQMRLDPTSKQECDEELCNVENVAGKTLAFTGTTDSYGAFVVVSRETSQGLQVSTQHIVPSAEVATAIATMRTDASWIDYCMTSWGATGKAILQGALLGE